MKLIKKIIFSTRLMAILFIAFGIAMGLGTFIETKYSIETARIWIYNAWWFELIMLFFMVNFIGNIKRYNLLKRENWAVLLLHLSWIFIIVGAFITRYISDEGIMSIREGETSDFYLSDRTYVTVFVDGTHQGQGLRKSNQTEVLFSQEADNQYRWKSDFKGIPFEITYKDFIKGAEKGIVPDSLQGQYYLKIVESGGGSRHEHYIGYGEVMNLHGTHFAFNRPTDGAINISMTEEGNYINPPFEGEYMVMATQERFPVYKDSLQPLHLRSLYSLGLTNFVIPEPMIRGREGVSPLPKEEITKESPNAVVFTIKVAGEEKEVGVIGGKGYINEPTTITVGGLDFHLYYGSRREQLPFSITLNDFIAEKYPGTEKSYSSFMSKVTVIEDNQKKNHDIYMNHILNYKGYRFFQASFHPDEKGTVLSVNQDYWGTLVTYTGYFLLYIGLIAFMFVGKSHFRKLVEQLKKIQGKRATLSVLLLFISVSAMGQHIEKLTDEEINKALKATTVEATHAEKFGKLVIQDAGRMKPVDTFTSELLRKISKKDTYNGMSANQVFLSMMLNPSLWYHVPFVYIKKDNDSLHRMLEVEKGKKYVSAIDFFDDKMNYKLSPYLQEAYSTNTPNKFQSDFKEADQKLGLLTRTLSGDILKIFPLKDDKDNRWISTLEFREKPTIINDTLYANFVKGSVILYLNMLREAINTGDYKNADALLETFTKNQQDLGSKVLPPEDKIKAEILYNKYDIFKSLFSWYLYVGLIMFTILIVRIFSDNKFLRIGSNIGAYLVYFLFLLHTLGLMTRWYISGHAPWSDAYESMIYVAWATMAMGLFFAKRSPLTLASTAFVTSMILMIAHWNWMDPSIGTLQPVLNSYWLMIHVAVIVGSYGPFSLGAILGIVSMFLMIFTNNKNKPKMSLALQELAIVNELSLTVGLVMLTIGNFLGGMWANESWGRYWGWDPKETWALISIMVYAFVIHMRLVPALRGRWSFSFASTVAFFSILMTYFGVNFYLTGLHSYASGEKIITPAFVYYSVAFVMILGMISYWRYIIYYKKK